MDLHSVNCLFALSCSAQADFALPPRPYRAYLNDNEEQLIARRVALSSDESSRPLAGEYRTIMIAILQRQPKLSLGKSWHNFVVDSIKFVAGNSSLFARYSL